MLAAARGGRARRRARALHARDDGRDERAARAARARGRRSSRPRASSTSCTCGARTARTSTGSALEHPEPLVPLERCVGVRGADRPRRRADAARPRLAAGRSTRRRSRSACSSRSATRARARGRRRSCAGAIPEPTSSPPTRSAPEFREYERASTTAVDAYLGPVLARYLARSAARCGAAGCRSRS